MSFLDRFRPQPRWKHADPLVRAAAVAEIPDDEEHRPVLAELAGTDEDVRVRRAAAARVDAVEELLALARSERDEELRRELTERLVAVATRPADHDGDAALALEGLDDQKQLATVAKQSPHETVRAAALGRIHDTRLLGSVARRAGDPQTALDAVMRLADSTELTNVALRTDHKDAGIAALERAAEAAADDAREMLESVAGRAKNRAVGKRARAMIQAIEEAATARRAALEQWQQRVASVMARLEALAASPGSPDAQRQITDAEAEWRELSGGADLEMDQETASRFGALLAAARAAIERHEREEAERRAEAERQEAIRAVRLSLCQRLESLQDESAADEVDRARAEWEGLPPPGEQARADDELRALFEEACRRAMERQRTRQERRGMHARLAELSLEAERLAAPAELSEHAWAAVVAEWHALYGALSSIEGSPRPRVDEAAPVPADGAESSQVDAPAHPAVEGMASDDLDPAVVERFRTAEAAVTQREGEKRAAAERGVRQQMQRIAQLVDRAHTRAAAEDLTLKEADRAARELRAVVDAPPPVEEGEQRELLERVKGALAVLSPKLHELREMDEWKRFANAAVQEELIAKTEALRTKYGFETPEGPKPEDVEKAARELHDIQERWKQVAEAPRAQAQALWHRYRQAADPIQAKAREFFAHRAEERNANLQKKLALIERAEALADSTDWIRTADELKKLQNEWQQIGAVPRHETKATWKRFRDACDRFFTRRNADLALRKETWSANLARKDALCARAEELAQSRDWDRAAAEIRRLQAEWKTVGPVRRNKSEAVWQRFRAACDTFFDRYKRRDEIELEMKQADREALVTELESLVAGASAPAEAGAAAPENLLERVRSLRSRWNQTTPVVRQGADPLSARFVGALEGLIGGYPEAFRGTELDVEASRQKMEKLCVRVEGFLGDVAVAAPANPSKALADMLREALATNTIGGRGSDESKWRAMADDVRQAQASWSRLGPVPGETGRELAERFHRACNRFFEQYRRRVPQTSSPRGGRPVGAR